MQGWENAAYITFLAGVVVFSRENEVILHNRRLSLGRRNARLDGRIFGILRVYILKGQTDEEWKNVGDVDCCGGFCGGFVRRSAGRGRRLYRSVGKKH
jgi:hypothetical protein